MTQELQTEFGPLAVDALALIGRAASDLRRGLPVVLVDNNGQALLFSSTELVDDIHLAAYRELGGAQSDLILTTERAETLKIRPYTENVVLIPLEKGLKAKIVHSLADATEDLANPLRGPFEPRRGVDTRLPQLAVRLAKIALLLPSVITCPLTVKDVTGWAAERKITLLRADTLADYDETVGSSLTPVVSARVPLDQAENTKLIAFRPGDGSLEHIAIVIGEPNTREPVLIRIHSECFTGDLIGSLKCDCGDQLRGAIGEIAAQGSGILIYLAQEGRGIGLINKLRAYQLQDQGFDTNDANERVGFGVDERHFLPAAEILRKLGHSSVRLMTNNPLKVEGLEHLGIKVTERVPHKFPSNQHNELYLRIKAEKSGHFL